MMMGERPFLGFISSFDFWNNRAMLFNQRYQMSIAKTVVVVILRRDVRDPVPRQSPLVVGLPESHRILKAVQCHIICQRMCLCVSMMMPQCTLSYPFSLSLFFFPCHESRSKNDTNFLIWYRWASPQNTIPPPLIVTRNQSVSLFVFLGFRKRTKASAVTKLPLECEKKKPFLYLVVLDHPKDCTQVDIMRTMASTWWSSL